MDSRRSKEFLNTIMGSSPKAYCNIRGSDKYPAIEGVILFFETYEGSLVYVEVKNLPVEKRPCSQQFFGFHIHEGDSCSGDATDAFADVGAHWNPDNCPHPAHKGDLPVLLASQEGHVFTIFSADNFKPADVVGHTMIVHRMTDDFMTQPSGNSGEKIACGVVE